MATETKNGGLLGWYFGTNLLVRIVTGLVLGGIVGIALGFQPETAAAFIKYTRIFGDIFVNLLKMIVVPVIFFSLIVGAASLSPSMLGRVGVRTILFYMLSTLFAVFIGLVVATVLEPGAGLNMAAAGDVKGATREAPSMMKVLLDIIPTNPFDSLAKGAVLPIIFFALCVGISLAALREAKDEVLARQANIMFDACSAFAECIYKIVGGIMQYAPIGVFFLIAMVFAQQGPKVVGPLLFVTLAVYIALVIQYLVCYGGLLTLNGLSLVKFTRGASDAMITAFVTRSSSATLPVSMRVSEENLGASRTIAAFALPIGATINMNGTAIYIAVCAMFIGNACNMPLTFDQQFSVMITATLAAIGTAGVPGAGALMLIMALESIGIKLEAGSAVAATYAMILGIDALLDMGRTCMNITGDICGVVLVSKGEKMLDMSVWKS